jgi:hypothetical protein
MMTRIVRKLSPVKSDGIAVGVGIARFTVGGFVLWLH